jgi:hypothetical protein
MLCTVFWRVPQLGSELAATLLVYWLHILYMAGVHASSLHPIQPLTLVTVKIVSVERKIFYRFCNS